MVVVTEGRYTATAGSIEYDMAARDFLLVMAGHTVDLRRLSGAAQPLVRCDYTLRADCPIRSCGSCRRCCISARGC